MISARHTGVIAVISLVAIVLTVTVAPAVAPRWSRDTGLDVVNVVAVTEQYDEERTRGQQLTDDRNLLRSQMEASEGVAARLAGGNLSLTDAVREFDAINRDRPGFEESLDYRFNDCPTREAKLARAAIARALARLEGDPSHQAEVQRRLEAEYATLPH